MALSLSELIEQDEIVVTHKIIVFDFKSFRGFKLYASVRYKEE